MRQVSELLGAQRKVANGNTNNKIWRDFIYNVKVDGAKGDGVADDTMEIQSAIAAASESSGVVAFPPGTYVTSSFTVPSNVTLWFLNGAKLSINSGATVTINGCIDAGLYQIFSGSGVVSGALKVEKLYPEWWGAKADGVTDDATAIQKAINTGMNAGCSVYLTDGTYLTSSTLTIDNSSSAYFNDPKKIHLHGAGNCQTTIKYTGNSAAIRLIGGLSGDLNSFMTYQQITNMRILGSYVTGSIGISVYTCSFLHLQNVEIQGMDYGFSSEDMDNSSFTKCIFHFNNYGIKMQEKNPRNPLTSTRPNNINFYDCQIGGNLNWGGLFIGGCTVNFFGGDVQGNGLGGADATKWGLMFLDMAVQGAVACNLYGVFFESNIGVADLWLYTQTASPFGISPAVYNVNGCTFNRSQNTWLSQNNILVGFNAAVFGQQKVVITSCGFKNFNDTYTPNVGRVHLKFSIDARSASNCYFKNNVQSNDVEAVTED